MIIRFYQNVNGMMWNKVLICTKLKCIFKVEYSKKKMLNQYLPNTTFLVQLSVNQRLIRIVRCERGEVSYLVYERSYVKGLRLMGVLEMGHLQKSTTNLDFGFERCIYSDSKKLVYLISLSCQSVGAVFRLISLWIGDHQNWSRLILISHLIKIDICINTIIQHG